MNHLLRVHLTNLEVGVVEVDVPCTDWPWKCAAGLCVCACCICDDPCCASESGEMALLMKFEFRNGGSRKAGAVEPPIGEC